MTKFDAKFERDVLSRALTDEEFFKKASRVLDAHKFGSEQYSMIWKVACKSYTKHKELVSKALLLRKISRKIENVEDLDGYVEIIRNLYLKKSKTAKIAFEELEQFVRYGDASIAMERAIDLMDSGKVDETYKVFRNLSQNQVKARNYTRVEWIEEFPQRLATLKEERDHPEICVRVPTGLRSLDNVIGGIQAGELGLIMGVTGAGKSVTLTNFSHGAVSRGHSVLYVGLEMSARQIAMRQDARAFRVLYDSLKYYRLTKEDRKTLVRKFKKFTKRYRNKLQIVSMPLNRCDIMTLEGLLDDLKQESGFVPEVILVDSGDHLNALDKNRDYRLQQSAVYWDLKNFAKENHVAVWSSTQAGREWAKKVATAEAASESYDKSRIADIVLSINLQNAHSRSTKILLDTDESDDSVLYDPQRYREMFLSKYRDGQANVLIPLTSAFEYSLLEELE